jgi:predicted DNA-binding transcriptional regulator AlpA
MTTTFPVLLGLAEMVELFPVAKGTVYRWNTPRDGHKQLPEPAYVISGTSVWSEDQVRAFADGKALELDEATLGYIREQQAKRIKATGVRSLAHSRETREKQLVHGNA